MTKCPKLIKPLWQRLFGTGNKPALPEIKRMDIKEFWQEGYLMEANRQFFHPLGLALEIVKEEDGSCHLGGVWDYRDDPEGLFFGELDEADKAKSERVKAWWDEKAEVRLERYGYVIQPIEACVPSTNHIDPITERKRP